MSLGQTPAEVSAAPEQPGPSPEPSCSPLEERGALLGPGPAPLHNDISSAPAPHAPSGVTKSVTNVFVFGKNLGIIGLCLKGHQFQLIYNPYFY